MKEERWDLGEERREKRVGSWRREMEMEMEMEERRKEKNDKLDNPKKSHKKMGR